MGDTGRPDVAFISSLGCGQPALVGEAAETETSGWKLPHKAKQNVHPPDTDQRKVLQTERTDTIRTAELMGCHSTRLYETRK